MSEWAGVEFRAWSHNTNWNAFGARVWNRIKLGWKSLIRLISRVAGLFTQKSPSLEALHRKLLEDPALKWDRTAQGCHSRAVIIAKDLEEAGIPGEHIGKIWLVHRDKMSGGTCSVQTRVGNTEHWGEHLAVTVMTQDGLRVIDRALFDSPVDLQTWLKKYPGIEGTGSPPTSDYINTLLGASKDQFEALIKIAANDLNRMRHLLNNVDVANRAAAAGINVERWIQSQAPISEPGLGHIAALSRRASQTGALVQGEMVSIPHGTDPFTDFFWDSIDGGRLRGADAARAFLRDL